MRRLGFCILLGLMFAFLDPTRGVSQFPSRGDGGSSRGFGMGDPSKLFDLMSGGKDVATRDTLPNPFLAGMFDRFAQQMGVTNGVITREQFTVYMQQQAAARAAASGGTPGGTFDTKT